MTDIKLFRIGVSGAQELAGASVAIERTLQTLIERNLEVLLGLRFLASEYSTGKVHGGRIDTLGLDENHAPIILEYKRTVNENVISQGLYYLDWLLDHKAEFKLLAMERLGKAEADAIDWRFPRLLCVAADFTRYDQYAVQQINRNIELIRYRRYGDDLLLLEMVNEVREQPIEAESAENGRGSKKAPPAPQPGGESGGSHVLEMLSKASPELQALFETLRTYLLALGDDVQMKPLKFYVAFRRLKTFACVQVHPHTRAILVYLKVDPDTVTLEPHFTRDVRDIGHYGMGDLEITIRSDADVERAKELVQQSYMAS